MNVLIAVPAMEMMHSQTAQCMLRLRLTMPGRFSFVIRATVEKARNMLAFEALDSGADRILWLDSDMVFCADLMERLDADLNDGWDVVSGLCFTRSIPVQPVIYKALDIGAKVCEPYLDYPEDAIFPIAACGFGAVMMKADVLRRIDERPFDLIGDCGEDLSFCHRAAKAGARIACDSRVKVGHLALMNLGEKAYMHPGGQK